MPKMGIDDEKEGQTWDVDKITEAILGLALAALAWFVKAKMNSYDKKHDKHFEDIADLKERSAALEAFVEVMKPRNGRSR